MATLSLAEQHYQRACQVLAGGVNSSTRLNQALGVPLFAARSEGSSVWDLDGNRYIDMCCGHGAALLGHAHPAVNAAVEKAIQMGYACAFETEYHEELARSVCHAIPCAELVRFCNSGTEATLHLIRACRAFTGRKKILRCEGHFHGYHELIYIGGHPPPSQWPDNRCHPFVESPGIPAEFADLILPIPFNDIDALEQVLDRHEQEIAVAIIEPVNYNSGCTFAEREFLNCLRSRTRDAGIILCFDEIQSAFKTRNKSAQQDFGVIPDVCTIGKSLGGGLPLTALCGRAEIMSIFKPTGPVQHSGTFNAPLLNVLAGLAFLEEIENPAFYSHLETLETRFHAGIDRILRDAGIPLVVPHYGARFSIVFGRETPPSRYEDTFCHDPRVMLHFIKACAERGVYFHDYGGAPVHHGYSVQHSIQDIDHVLAVIEDCLKNHCVSV